MLSDHLFLYHKCNKTVPFRPKGVEVYVFKPDNQSDATYENPVSGAVRLYDSGLALEVSASIEMCVCV